VEKADAPRPTWPYRPVPLALPLLPRHLCNLNQIKIFDHQFLTSRFFFLDQQGGTPLFSVSWGTAGTPPTLAASSGLSPTAVAVVAVALRRRRRSVPLRCRSPRFRAMQPRFGACVNTRHEKDTAPLAVASVF